MYAHEKKCDTVSQKTVFTVGNGSRRAVSRRTCNEEKTMKYMSSTIKEAQLARLRTLRNEIAERSNFERNERLRKQREAESIQDYWQAYAQHTTKRTGRGAR